MLQVLFVDDELLILEGLRDALRPRRKEWQMRFRSSASEALDELATKPADVVVTDLRMPGMDGVKLLREVSRIDETTVRIVLSGYAEDALAAGAAQIAHAVLMKPCDTQALRAAIEIAGATHA
jgi:YesN/AraC family two-component response regulator